MSFTEEVYILALPKLRISHVKAAQKLSNLSYEVLLLMFPRELEEQVKTLAEGLPYQYVVKEIKKRKLIPEPFGAWEYYAEPILKMLFTVKKQNPNLDIYCYGNSAYENILTETATKIATLTLKALTTGRIDIKEWEKTLLEELQFSLEVFEEEAEFILSVIEKYKKSLCISSLSGKNLKEKIVKKRGLSTKIEYFDIPYKLTPLEIIKNELLKRLEGKSLLSEDKIEKIIRCHINYVKKYVLLSKNLDEAYFKWVDSESKQLENIAGKDKAVFLG